MKTDKYIYTLHFKVRDYECDLQGIVNNANYQHYFEHTRHEFLVSKGVSFAELHEQGIDAVVARVEIAYKTPLRSMDEFDSMLRVYKDGIKYIFEQILIRKSDNQLCSKGKITSVVTEKGKLLEGFVPFDRLVEESEQQANRN